MLALGALLDPLLGEPTSWTPLHASSRLFVDRAAETVIKAKLEGSRFASAETVDCIVSLFEEKTKRKFIGAGEISYIKFGESTDTDRSHGVSMGRLTLTRCGPSRSLPSKRD